MFLLLLLFGVIFQPRRWRGCCLCCGSVPVRSCVL